VLYAPLNWAIFAIVAALSYSSRSKKKFSTSRENRFSTKIVASLMSIALQGSTADRGAKIMSDTVVLDVSRDWAKACDVQECFMQHASPIIDTLSYGACCRQVCALAGDFYDFMPLPHNRVALGVRDASGKGLAAVLMIANVQSSLRTAASFTGNHGPVVPTAVSHQVYASSLEDRFATLFYDVLDGATRRLPYVMQATILPMVIGRDRSIVMAQSCGAPVGIFPNSTYEQGAVQLKPGDLILAYTDGVIEAVKTGWRPVGSRGTRVRLISSVRNSGESVETLDSEYSCYWVQQGGTTPMMGQQSRTEWLFYYFRLEEQVPADHLLRMNVCR
jgi:serine phosphatase RsbU (regulator of sigma subunit)